MPPSCTLKSKQPPPPSPSPPPPPPCPGRPASRSCHPSRKEAAVKNGHMCVQQHYIAPCGSSQEFPAARQLACAAAAAFTWRSNSPVVYEFPNQRLLKSLSASLACSLGQPGSQAATLTWLMSIAREIRVKLGEFLVSPKMIVWQQKCILPCAANSKTFPRLCFCAKYRSVTTHRVCLSVCLYVFRARTSAAYVPGCRQAGSGVFGMFTLRTLSLFTTLLSLSVPLSGLPH
jgi:hypothetical protein